MGLLDGIGDQDASPWGMPTGFGQQPPQQPQPADPANAQDIDDAGLDFIKSKEGYSPTAYKDGKQWSIGYGTKAKGPDDTIKDEQEAHDRLDDETSDVGDWIRKNITRPLTQKQFNALTSFGYNAGVGNLAKLKDDINAGNDERVAARMPSFFHSDDEKNDEGLKQRRQLEAAMYLGQDPAAPQPEPGMSRAVATAQPGAAQGPPGSPLGAPTLPGVQPVAAGAQPPAGGQPPPSGQPPQQGFDPYAAVGMQQPPQRRQPGFLDNAFRSPAFLAGLSILGAPPGILGGNWGQNAVQGAHTAMQADMAYNEDPINEAAKRSQVASNMAHANYFNSAGSAMKTRADALQQNAMTKRMQAYGGILDKLGANPDEATWTRESQPGGIVNAAFNGMPPPYSAAPQVIKTAQAYRSAMPEEQELVDRGWSTDQIRQFQRSKDLEKVYGPAKRGYMWTTDQQGRPVQQLMAEKEDPKQAIRDRGIPQYINQLEESRQVLANTNPLGRSVAHYTNGWAGYSSTKEAMDQAGHAIAQLTAMVEGNRHANAQDVRFLHWFSPQPGDPNEIISFKLSQAQKIFKAYLSNKAAGRTDDYLENRFRSQLSKAYDEGQKKAAPAQPQQQPQGEWSIKRIDVPTPPPGG